MIIGLDASRAAQSQRTGTETYALELIKRLASLTAGAHTLRLYTSQPPQPMEWPVAPHVETRVMPWPRLWTHTRLAAELVQHPPEVLFVPAHVIPWWCPVPAVVTVHDLGYQHYPRAHRAFDRRYLAWTTRRHTRVARHILADSAATKQDLISFYNADPDRISVVYLGRDESLRRVTDFNTITAAMSRYGIKGPYLLYLGTLHPRKNLVRMVKAFHAAIESIAQPDVTLVIAGKRGWLYDEIFATIERLGLSQRVILPGYVADADKPALLSGAVGYVFPSLFEGFGLPVLEAMACGTPVLTSDVSSLPEVAGEAAWLVNPHRVDDIAAGLVRLCNDAGLRQTLVARGYQQIQKFSWDAAARQVLEILTRCC